MPTKPAAVMPNASVATLRFSSDLSAAGLFVCWRPTPIQGSTGVAPFSLGFCAKGGKLIDVTVANPWKFAFSDSAAKTLIRTLQDQDHDFVLISHPSPIVAKTLLERLNKGEPVNGTGGSETFPIVTIRPTFGKGNAVVDLPTTSDKYVPKGHSEFGGWVLYRHMPHEGLPEVAQAVKKLAHVLGQLRFPCEVEKSLFPYAISPTSHEFGFNIPVQASLHNFFRAVDLGVAFELSDEGKARAGDGMTERETWGFLLGESIANLARQTLPEEPAAPMEAGVVDEQTGVELFAWKARRLRRHGDIIVGKSVGSTSFFAQPDLWLSYRALALTLKVFGVPYGLPISNTSRTLEAKGSGQVENSFHKLGRAIDFDMAVHEVRPRPVGPSLGAEPSAAFPVAFEGNWNNPGELRWQVYAHSTLNPTLRTEQIEEPLKEAHRKLTAEVKDLLGDNPPLKVRGMLLKVEKFYESLVAAATDGTLGAKFFRDKVSRFQYQAGEKDGGKFMPEVGAAEDAEFNSVPGAIASWVNVSRLAFNLGLKSIGAHTDEMGAKSGTTSRPITPGADANAINRAIRLDELGEGIRLARELGLPSVKVTTPSTTVNVNPNTFNLSAIQDWMRRRTDNPDKLPPPPSGVSYATNGVDMTVDWPLGQNKERERGAIRAFLGSRAEIPVTLVHVGDGLSDGSGGTLSTNTSTTVEQVRTALHQSSAGTGSDRTIVVRPVFESSLPEGDPATFTYEIVDMHLANELEWWHFEIQPESDNLFWSGYAELLGLDATVLEAPVVPRDSETPPDVPWMGGSARKRSKFATTKGTEPNNAPGRELVK
jgi:hypothetical protein